MHISLDSQRERALIESARYQPEAFRELYRHYFPRLYAYVACRVGRVPDAEDLVANIFVKVIEALHRFEYRGEGAFAAWLFSIAHNEVSGFWRFSLRERGRSSESLSFDDLPELTGGEGLLPEGVLLRKEQFARLRTAIEQLSPRRQEIVTLRFFGELRNHEIAVVLHLDERTVASHLSRALEDLQRMYEREQESLS